MSNFTNYRTDNNLNKKKLDVYSSNFGLRSNHLVYIPDLNAITSVLEKKTCIISDLTIRDISGYCSDASRLLFYSAIGKNTSLISLNLSESEITASGAGAQRLSEALKINSKLTSLNLSGNNIKDTGAKHLSEALKTNSSLTSLDIVSNNIGETGAKHISEALVSNSTLTSLDIRFNSLGPTGAKHLGEALKTNSTLTSLDIGYNRLLDYGATRLSEALETNSTLTTLDILGNEITDTGAKDISEALKTNSTLTKLNIGNSGITGTGAKHLGEALKINSTLTSLNIHTNYITDTGAKHLSEALKTNSTLTKLNIGNSGITGTGAKHLGEALKINSTLTKLILYNNRINETGAKHLSEALKINSTLTKLNINSNDIKDTGAKHLGDALKTNSTLTTLDIKRNKIGATGAKHLGEALKTNSKLTSLVLYNNSIGDSGAKHISEALKTNSTLTSLDIGYNIIGETGAIHIIEALKTNSSLTSLDIRGSRIGDPVAIHIGEALKTNSTLATLYIGENQIADTGVKHIIEAMKTNSTLTTLEIGNHNVIDYELRPQLYSMIVSNKENAKKLNKSTGIINSHSPVKLSGISTLETTSPLPNLTSDIALSTHKTAILRSLQKWASVASSLLASTNDTHLLSQRQIITEFFTAYESNLLPNIKSLKEMDSTPCIPTITDVWFDILESLKSNFTHLQSKITAATKNLKEHHQKNITAFRSSLSQESSKFEKITSLPFKQRLLQLSQLETSVSQTLTSALTQLQTKTTSLQKLGLPTSTTEDTIPPLQEEMNSLLSDIRSWKRSEEQFSKSASIPSNLVKKLPNQQGIYGGQATVYQATYLGTPVALKEFFPNVAKDLKLLEDTFPLPKSSPSRSRTTRTRRNNHIASDSTKSQDPQDPRSKAFWQEAETFARLSHPNIVQHFGSILNPPGILLEWCPKGNLTLLIKDANDLEKDTVSTMNMLHTNSKLSSNNHVFSRFRLKLTC